VCFVWTVTQQENGHFFAQQETDILASTLLVVSFFVVFMLVNTKCILLVLLPNHVCATDYFLPGSCGTAGDTKCKLSWMSL
jgi:hypothetical protein